MASFRVPARSTVGEATGWLVLFAALVAPMSSAARPHVTDFSRNEVATFAIPPVSVLQRREFPDFGTIHVRPHIFASLCSRAIENEV